MRATGPTAMVRREWRRVSDVYAPLVEAALDQPRPTAGLRAALTRILGDPMLQHFLGHRRKPGMGAGPGDSVSSGCTGCLIIAGEREADT